MVFLLRRLATRPPIFGAIIFASLIINILALASPLFVIQVLNRYIAHGVDATLATLAMGALFAVFMEFGFRQIRLNFAKTIAIKPDEEIAIQNYRLMTAIKLNTIEQVPAGLRRQFLASSDALERMVAAPNVATLMDLPFAALFIGVLFLLSPALALIATVFLIFVLLLGLVGMSAVNTATTKLFKEKTVGSQHTGSVLNAADEVYSFRARGFLLNRWQNHLRQAQELTRQIASRRGLIQSLNHGATAAMTIAIITLGAVMVVHGELNVGVMIGANILASRALSTVSRFTMLGENFARTKQSLDLLRKFREMPKEMMKGAALENYRGRIEFQDVSFIYPNKQRPLFESLSLAMPPGTFLLVKGANGSGKSTFCRMMLGLLEPQRGNILVDGVDLLQIVPNWWRSQICYLPQASKFLNATIRENLSTLNPEIDEAGLNKVLETTGLKSFIAESSSGVDLRLNDNGRELSAGIRRRLALARALTGDGKLVVFDEPTEALDAEGCKTVRKILNQLRKDGKTIIVVSEDPQIVNLAHITLDLNAKPVPRITMMPGYSGRLNNTIP